ncbi:MAG: nodulation protein NfeD [Actinobacteria bacterium]|nr:nodulation protein NfeD [Actinomycetota bacterium]
MKTARIALASALLLAGLLAFVSPAAAAPHRALVIEYAVEGVVDPFVASYIEEGLDKQQGQGFVTPVIIRIDTPGGLSSSMRDIVQAILAADFPVVCWVGPEGARAASAGAFILIACPVAAMAPGTNVGAAHPVGVSGAIESRKAENDAAAYIRSLAELRGRNPDWAERAVRESVSVTAEEALELGIIDHVVADEATLLAEIDGTEVEVAGGRTVTIASRGAGISELGLGLAASILHSLITPDLAFLFFFAGLILIVIEVLAPGVSIPGVLGALFLILAFISFGQLPVTITGLVLIAISAIAFFVDLKAPGSGVATGVGLVTLVLGGLFLFDSSVPNARVSYPTIAAVAVLLALFFGITVNKVLKARRMPVEAGMEAIVGEIGVAETRLAPTGMVRARGESWSADAAGGVSIPKGARVVVRAVNRLRLEVEPAESDAPVRASEKGTVS